ncbi:FAD-dependent oxidoreductase [Sneathiella sp. P13V-1]|uniref:NAD(P)/FAD-dependent oxidoreductase n=1 Tax=Sneathiella sp. P13V-1 TaxID=2697366 RepID=UPI00187B1099|nr:NAD(P)/FAD-dependent oxidoreductase [Sneathiella sp. P13V-1]MBE7636513.1 FAD-dependent oxidoreductase [Sneathiella sp. P13V-1]
MQTGKTNSNQTVYDVAIIGAGPAGALAAKKLRDQGASVVILERETFPRFSIGESLLPHCLNLLENAGLLQPVIETGFQFKNGAAFQRGDEKRDIDFREKYDAGWGTAYQVKRAEFDKVLADNAEKAGADILYGRTVTRSDLNKGDCHLTHVGEDGDTMVTSSRFVLDASGFGRVLSKLEDLELPSTLAMRTVLFTHMEDQITDPEFDRNKILITVHPKKKDVWYWTIPFSDGTSSVGVVYSNDEDLPDEEVFKRHLQETHLGELLKNASQTRPLGKIKGYSCDVKSLHGPGFALLGNAAEFLDPIFSSGVTIALQSSELAVPLVLKELEGQSPDWENDFSKPLKKGVDVFRVFVQSWYEGGLQDIILNRPEEKTDIELMMVSILSGYAWSEDSPLVQNPTRILRLLEKMYA